ncbi:MAG TPA: hypothetical protein VG206_16950 [Terriglobia bacterium]|nr:hypothetical protein [Terriglobia bacterium]
MSNRYRRLFLLIALAFAGLSAAGSRPSSVSRSMQAFAPGDSVQALNWQSSARLHHGLKATPGNLILSGDGIEFRPDKERFSHRWLYSDVETFDLTPRRLVITDYQNRRHHMPGERRFRFDLANSLPPAVAAQLAQRVGKPVRNGDPDLEETSLVTIPARHGTRFGGTNGTLRFRDEGIDYVAAGGEGSRSWRWSDLQTLANPDPYHFRIGGYRDIFEFELKQPMSRQLFERLWDRLYASDLNISLTGGGTQ